MFNNNKREIEAALASMSGDLQVWKPITKVPTSS
jgi:hypothetical protein